MEQTSYFCVKFLSNITKSFQIIPNNTKQLSNNNKHFQITPIFFNKCPLKFSGGAYCMWALIPILWYAERLHFTKTQNEEFWNFGI